MVSKQHKEAAAAAEYEKHRAHKEALAKANEEINLVTKLQHPNLTTVCPRFHVVPPCGWMNDPNGLVYHNGQYHAFYQFHPYSLEWGPMHWGHAVSTDMVRWVQQPVALAPSETYDWGGCFSGSAISVNNRLFVVYTGHTWESTDPQNQGDHNCIEVQCLAVSDDGVNFQKMGVIIRPPAQTRHFRDPKVWGTENGYYLVVGAKLEESDGTIVPQVLLYSSENLFDWRFDRVLLQGDSATDGYMFECPDFFQVDGESVLVASPQGMTATEYSNQNLFQSGAWRGDYEEGGSFQVRQPFAELDMGQDFYAPQTLEAPDGRRVMFGWANMWKDTQPSIFYGFTGSLTLPRELRIVDGKLLQIPVKETESLRDEGTILHPQNINFERVVLNPSERSFEFILQFDTGVSTAKTFGVQVVDGLVFEFERLEDGRLQGHIMRRYHERGLVDDRYFIVDDVPVLRIHGFVDHSVAELFFNDYSQVATVRCYPNAGEYRLEAYAVDGNLVLSDGMVWRSSPSYRIDPGRSLEVPEALLNWPPAHDNR